MDKSKVIAKAQKYIQKGQIDRAIAEYEKAVKADQKDVVIRLRLGDLYAKAGRRDEAIKEYMEVADAHARSGFTPKAIAVYKQILKLNEDLREVHLRLADLYRKQGLLAEAMYHYSIVIKALEEEGNLTEALPILKRLAESDPENLSLRLRLIKMNYELGNMDGAVEQIRETGASLMKKGEMERLELFCKRLIENGIVTEEVYRRLIDVYSRRGDTEALLNTYRELLHFLKDRGEDEKVRQVCAEILQVSPGDEEAIKILGAAEETPSAEVEEMDEVEIVGLAEEEDPETHYNMGIAYMEMGLFDKAIEDFEKALKDPAFEFDSYTRLGLCFSAIGEYSKACEYLEKALELPGRSREEYRGLLYDLALAYEGAGSLEKALELFKRVYDEDKDFREVAKKVEELSRLIGN